MQRKVLLSSLFIFSFLFLGYQHTYSQDMSNVRVDELSDAQVRQFLQQVESAGLTEAELEQVALSKGMSSTEVQKLRKRVNDLKKTSPGAKPKLTNGTAATSSTVRTVQDTSERQRPIDTRTEAEKALEVLKTKIFGASLFKNANPQFQPNLEIATPKNYIIGTGDELMIEIYGNSEASYQLTVSPEGNINIPYIGVVSVGGATIEAATSRIKNRLSTIYSGISSGNTQVSITLSNIRSISVILSGELVQPGTYTLPSIATVFNALYTSGGPTEHGSLRDIRIIRNGKQLATLDVYDFLVRGSLENNITLQDQDVIYVPPYLSRVELTGEVKRPLFFEVKPGESFNDLLSYAGGFTENAYQGRVKVVKTTGIERRIEDVLASQFGQYEPKSGDKFTVSRILDRFENRVSINGSVFRPGEYELSPGLSLSMLIKKADGVTEDAFLNRGYILRLKPDLQSEQLSFNVSNILAGIDPDIPLKKEDVIQISSITDLKDEYKVTIQGEVREPDTFAYAENMTVGSLIQMAGGFKDGASPDRIEIARRIDKIDVNNTSAPAAEVFTIKIDKDLKVEDSDFVLRPFDIVSIRTESGYELQMQVKLEGEVRYPGTYTITRKNERISDIIARAGGLTAFAYAEGASLTRPSEETKQKEEEAKRARKKAIAELGTDDELDIETWLAEEKIKAENEQKMLNMQRLSEVGSNVPIKREGEDVTTIELQEIVSSDLVGINLDKILERPKSRFDLFLEDGDIIKVPKTLQTVKVTGEVLRPNNIVYQKGKSFKAYVKGAGGFTLNGSKKGAYIQYANGTVDAPSSFLFIRSYPDVKPGAEIFVPKRAPREKLSAQGWVGISSAIVSMTVMIFSILK